MTLAPIGKSNSSPLYDVLVIGGGINGTAIARDAAGRGLSVCLCEKDDLANHTSSASTKLIHGGFRYLEQYDFKLVRASLKEREVLLRAAPHIIWPLRFVLPYEKQRRPKWLLRAGLFLYDHLGGREILPGTKTVDLSATPHVNVLDARLQTGFEYSDCWVEDSRLVILNAVDAAEKGAVIKTRTEVLSLTACQQGYHAEWTNSDGLKGTFTAKAVINAAGPWVETVLNTLKHGRNSTSLRLVKGSHIITKRLYDGDHAYIFQNADGRIIFTIPFENTFTLIGTTDVPFDSDRDDVKATPNEISYLCDAANDYFKTTISPQDVMHTYSGVRPLYDDQSTEASEVTRDYVLTLDRSEAGAPLISVYGGKITTSRKLAEHVLEKLLPDFPGASAPWTLHAKLPGGDIDNLDFEAFVSVKEYDYPAVNKRVLRRLCRAYGTRIDTVLKTRTSGDTITGRKFGAGLREAEVRYLVKSEWAKTADDILWRRSKLGLHMQPSEQQAFSRWFSSAFSNFDPDHVA